MADFRRWILALAVLALMAGAASAQVGVATGSANSLLACVANAAGTPELRPEGLTELVGDIVISCTGGPDYAIGAQIPTTNITVYVTQTGVITSRFLTTSGTGAGASEALLIIDEAGSNIPTGVAGNFGPKAPQVGCSTANQTTLGGSTCLAYVGQDSGNTNGPYAVAVNGPTSTVSAANVYQGQVNGNSLGQNSVTFFAVPVLPPATTGVSRTFRITNIRVPIVGLGLGATVSAYISTSPSTVLPLTQQALNIGVVGSPMNATVIGTGSNGAISPFQQCTPNVGTSGKTPQLAAYVVFTEGFATGFKTRVVPMSNTAYAAEGTNLTNQNTPGGLYGGFASNSESGFIFTGLGTTISSSNPIGYTAGLADMGTRLKATFYNIPTGLTLYVSTSSQAVSGASGFVVGGTSVNPYAVLVGTGGSDDTPDSATGNSGAAFGAGSTAGNPFPISSSVTGTDGLFAYPLAITANSTSSGPANSAVAVWEVTNANPSAQDNLKFSVYIAYAPASPTTANPYGTPITGLPLGAPVIDAIMNMTPDANNPADFAYVNGTYGLTAPIPRFYPTVKLEKSNFLTINLCQTTLLYPYVIGGGGFDTGIAVSNTSMDPWGTVNQTGSCKMYPYGVALGASGAANTVWTGAAVAGCDTMQPASQAPGSNCWPQVPAGQVIAYNASGFLPNFWGYVIAVCNFQYAHGYAAVTDTGVRNIFSSYLALEIIPIQGVGASSSRGTSNGGPQGIEQLIH